MAEKIKLAPVNIIDINKHKLMISPASGRWLLIDDQSLSIARSLNGEKTIKEIAAGYPNVRRSDVSRLVKLLDHEGLLESNVPPPCPAKRIPQPYYAVLNMTDQCNLHCEYCYAVPNQNESSKMTTATAIRIVDEMRRLNKDSGQKPVILFHGGEPLLNFEVIQAVAEYVKPFAEEIDLQIQTNGTLIREEHIKFFIEHNINVGVSIDGPDYVHDLTRRERNGSGSHAMAVKGIRELVKAGIGVGTITVLNRHNYAYAAEIVDHLIDLGIKSMAFCSIFAGGRCKGKDELFITGEQQFEAYKITMDKIVTYNSQCKNPADKIEERTLEHFVKKIFSHVNDYMCMRTPCGAGIDTLGFSTAGDVYVCDEVVNETDFLLGNIHASSLAEMIDSSELITRLSTRSIDTVEQCRTCIWKVLCNGVCPAHTYFLNTLDMKGDPECDFRKLMIPYLLESYAQNRFLPTLLLRDMNPKTGYYFNINYACNSNCLFCAADFTGMGDLSGGDIDGETFAAILKVNDVSRNDEVEINGGEPTVSQHLHEILRAIHKTGAYSCLFTNGRRLSDVTYCQALMETGVNSISIPLFGYNGADHDNLTMSPGSFAETAKGIANIIEIRQRKGWNVRLTLKLLYMKPTLDTNPQILAWIMKTYPEVDCVNLNSLIVSDKVKKNGAMLIPDINGWWRSVNETLDYARENDWEEIVELGNVPCCLLEKRNYCFLPAVSTRRYVDINRYYDTNSLGGLEKNTQTEYFPEFCRECVLSFQCGFRNCTYYDDEVAKNSIKMLFPDV